MVDDIIVVDDFLEGILFRKIKESLLLQDWYLTPDITFEDNLRNSKKHYGFYSMIIYDGQPEQYKTTPCSWAIPVE
jgi:hypothetical protein